MCAHAVSRVVISADPRFETQAVAELGRLAGRPRSLAAGVHLCEAHGSFHGLVRRWRSSPPVWTRHVHPVDATVDLEGDVLDAEVVAQQVRGLLAALRPDAPFSVQTRLLQPRSYPPRVINEAVAALVARETGAAVDVRRPQQVVSVTVAGTQAHIGVSNVADNLSAWAGGRPSYARDPDQVSRSELKLVEALETFGVQLPAHGLALDLGAAPGGWTRLAVQAGMRVVAVDPGDLHPSLHADPRITHERTTAGSLLSRRGPRFDVVLNDLRMDAVRSARLMVRLRPRVRGTGMAIVVLKMGARAAPHSVMHALDLLTERWQVLHARNLFHNRSEVTALLRPV